MNRRLIVGEILPLDKLEGLVRPQEWAESEKFGSPKRRCEWLSWRVHLRRELAHLPFCGVGADIEIEYSEQGAPRIVGGPIYIGVTHTSHFVAVLLSQSRCGVDMEHVGRNFGCVATRYLSEVEQSNPLALSIGWCAKEAAYKYAATPGLDFQRDITILGIDYQTGEVTLKLLDTHLTAHFTLLNEEQHIVVCI